MVENYSGVIPLLLFIKWCSVLIQIQRVKNTSTQERARTQKEIAPYAGGNSSYGGRKGTPRGQRSPRHYRGGIEATVTLITNALEFVSLYKTLT